MKIKKVCEVVFACSSCLLALMLALSTAGTQNAATINKYLNVTTYKVVNEDEGESEGDSSDSTYFSTDYSTTDELKEAYDEICREAEGEGIVLLKNDNDALPLDEGDKVSLFGQGTINFNYATSGSSSNTSTSSYASLSDALESVSVSVNEELLSFYNSADYQKYYRDKILNNYIVNEAPYSTYTSSVKSSYSSYGDAAIVTLSRDSGEGTDVTAYGSDGLDGSYLSITQEEKDLLQELTS